MKNDLARFGRGFVYAWHGILGAIREERNFRFHLCATLYVYAAAVLAELDMVAYALLTLCVCSVMAMELMNSAVERAVHKPDTTHWWTAGAAKDMAAGAVLITALGALGVGGCLFLSGKPPAIVRAAEAVAGSPLSMLALAVSAVLAYLFVFHFGAKEKEKTKETVGKLNEDEQYRQHQQNQP